MEITWDCFPGIKVVVTYDDPRVAEYVKNKAEHCPFCDDQIVSATDLEFENGIWKSKITCGSCKNSWIEVAPIIGYTEKDRHGLPLNKGGGPDGS